MTLMSQNVDMTSYVLKKDLNTNDIFEFYIDVSWRGASALYQVEVNDLPRLDGLDLHGSGASNKVSDDNGQTISKKLLTYKLKANRVGQVIIAPISIKVTDVQTQNTTYLNTQPLTLQIKEYIPPTEIDTKIIYFIIIAIVILAGIIAFIMMRAKKKKSDLEDFADMTERYIETKMLNRLSMIKNEPELVSKSMKEFIDTVEAYMQDDSVNKNTLTPREAENADSNEAYVGRLNEVRYSGEVLNTIDLEKMLNDFKSILRKNIDLRKDVEN
jgi:large-conductance mechanosensitive channel